MKYCRLTYIVVLIGLCGIIAGCAHHRPVQSLGWPPPPEKPQIVYQQSIYGSYNLKRSMFGRVKDFLLGKSPDLSISKPYGIAYDGKARLYIADTGKKGIMVMDFSDGSVQFFNSLGAYGRLVEPVNVILDGKGNVYVADTRLSRIAVFDRSGIFSHFIGDAGELASPVGLAYWKNPKQTGTDRLYVVDAKLHTVKIFSPAGEKLGSFGRRGDQRGEFYHPLGIGVNSGDTVYVVDAFHFAVQAFNADGDFLFSFGPTPTGIGSMARPRAIAIDSDNHVYVTDALNNNVQMYDNRGQLLVTFGVTGFAPGQFRLPAGICITDDDAIYVADSINRRIQEFKYLAVR